MACTEWELPVAEYLEGSLDAAGKARVEEHLQDCGTCKGVVAMWAKLGEAIPESSAPRADFPARFREKLAARPTSFGRMGWLAAAAAVLVGLFGFAAGRMTSPAGGSGKTEDLASLRKEVRNLREVVALSLLNQQSASERLRGIRYSAALDPQDVEVVAALTRTLRSDPSVNVRLAAADALRRFSVPSDMREPVWQLLESDESPLVQIAVIDLLSTSKDPGTAARLETLRNRPGLDVNVREYLESVLSTNQKKGNSYQ